MCVSILKNTQFSVCYKYDIIRMMMAMTVIIRIIMKIITDN